MTGQGRKKRQRECKRLGYQIFPTLFHVDTSLRVGVTHTQLRMCSYRRTPTCSLIICILHNPIMWRTTVLTTTSMLLLVEHFERGHYCCIEILVLGLSHGSVSKLLTLQTWWRTFREPAHMETLSDCGSLFNICEACWQARPPESVSFWVQVRELASI